MADGTALFFGVGVDNYDSGLPTLDHPTTDVSLIRRLLGPRFDGDPLLDPEREQVRAQLESLDGRLPGGEGVLVVMWTGHGIAPASGRPLQLLAKDSKANSFGGLSPDEVLGQCALSGCNQLLFLVDTCFSGDAISATRIAVDVLRSVASFPNRPPWVGVLAACSADVTARDGVFVEQLARLLEKGPRDPDLQRRWSRHSPLVRGDDLCDALLKEWPADLPQLPEYLATGSAWYMVSNPLWSEGAPPQVVEHLLMAARSGTEPQSWFTGRTAEVNQVVGWVQGRQPGVHIITGSAGTGKSAVLGRVVSASVQAERDRLLDQGQLGHADPGPGSITAHAHARGLTANRLAEVLYTGLENAGIVHPVERGLPNANLLLGAVEQAAPGWAAGEAPVLVIDGLDEARDEAFDIARNLLARLAEWATVIVSTRNLPGEGDSPDLVASLGPHVDLLDLDEATAAQSGRQAMRSYIVNRLRDIAESMDPELVANEFLGRTEATSGEPFLIARLLTDQLRNDPVDTASVGWQPRVVTSLAGAFELNLVMLEPPPHRVEANSAKLGRELLAALTWAFGAGFPEDEWLCVAQALSNAETPFDRDDVTWLLSQLGRFVIQDGEGGVAVYRLAHQSIADLLRADPADAAYEAMAQAVTARLLDRYRRLLVDGMPAEQPVYLWRYAWRHAVQAGEAGLGMLRELSAGLLSLRPDVAMAALVLSAELAERRDPVGALPLAEEAAHSYRALAADNPAFLRDLASSLNNLGNRYSELGRRQEALAPAEEAAQIYRALAADNPAFLPDLAGSLNNLGNRYSELGRWQEALAPAEEAAQIRRALAADNPAFLPDLAGSLNNLGNRYSELGRWQEALAPAEEAAQIRRALAADNPAFLPDLARSLNNLGNRYSQVGRRQEALAPAEEAAQIRRALAADNPAFLPGLAGSLNNLGIRYSQLGRWQDAVAPVEEAAQIYRALAADNPAFLPDLARSLNNLSIHYSQLGRWQDAVAPVEEAAQIYRALAADNPAFLPDLASSLNNLGNRYSQVGRRQEALAPAEEAAQIRRALAADNPAFLPDLAGSLNNLGNRYSELGRWQDAVAPVEEAAQSYRVLAADNPAFLPDLASSLNNLGNRYSELGRLQDAVAPVEEAAQIYRALAADNPAFLPDLAGSLNNLGNCYSQLGCRQEALEPVEEAVDTYRALAADNPAFLPDLAGSLNNLGIRCSELGRWQEALAPVEEAVDTYRALAAGNPVVLPNLAMALNNLGNCYSELGRWQDAVTPAEEAVQICRTLAADNPAFLHNLAGVLGNFTRYLNEVGRHDDGELAWRQTLDIRVDQAAALLYLRAAQAPHDEVRAVEWLATALTKPGLEPDLERAIHEEARTLRASDPTAFDDRWSVTTGKPVPSWLHIKPDLLEAAIGWVSTPTFEQEATWLAEHPKLLDSVSDAAVTEALLGIKVEGVNRLRSLRAAAKTDGVTAAYQPLLDAELFHRFLKADLADQADLLDAEGERLGQRRFIEGLSAFATQNDQDLVHAAMRAHALILLSTTGSHREAINALAEQAELDNLLRAAATVGRIEELSALATLLMAQATSSNQYAQALFYQAIAGLLNGISTERIRDLVHSLRRMAEAAEYINLAAAIGVEQPKALAIIPLLTEPLPPDVDDGEV